MVANIRPPRLVGPYVALTCCAITMLPQAAAGQAAIVPHCRLEPGPARAVAYVVDGETVRLDDGSEVRLIGALAPRAFDVGAMRGTWPAEQAAIQALTELVQGRSVMLWFGGDRVDRHGRLLAHVIIEEQGRQEWVQGAMLEQGMARAYTLPDHAACADALTARERLAREVRRGLWANAAYHIRPAERPRDLVALRHTFQLVRGVVRGVSRVRDYLYLNFGSGRTGFAARIKAASSALADGVQPRALQGRVVLMRGWIDKRTGPFIAIDAAGQLELLDSRGQFGSVAEPQSTAPGGEAAGRR